VPAIKVHEDRCTRCGACVAVCASAHVFELREGAAEPVRTNDCWSCGHCVAVCPTDAIHHSDYPLDACPSLDALPSYEELITALRARRSTRAYRDKPIPRPLVRQLVDVSRWAPSATNAQEVDWIALDEPTRIERLSREVVSTLGRLVRLLQNPLLRPFLSLALGKKRVEKAAESAEDFESLVQRQSHGEDPIFYHAPVVLIAHVPQGTYFGTSDAVYAAYNLMLAAERLGLGTCHIGFFNVARERNRELRDMVGLPTTRQIEVVITLGYPRFEFRRALPRRQRELRWNPEA